MRKRVRKENASSEVTEEKDKSPAPAKAPLRRTGQGDRTPGVITTDDAAKGGLIPGRDYRTR